MYCNDGHHYSIVCFLATFLSLGVGAVVGEGEEKAVPRAGSIHECLLRAMASPDFLSHLHHLHVRLLSSPLHLAHVSSLASGPPAALLRRTRCLCAMAIHFALPQVLDDVFPVSSKYLVSFDLFVTSLVFEAMKC